MTIKESKKCASCKENFNIDDWDLNFYKKIDVPVPTHCPDCRLQRRLTFRNERNLYKRICGLCKKNIVSIYAPDSPFKVYCQSCWWSDKWDPLEYGCDFDFSKPFFEQYKKLQLTVPRLALMNRNPVNSEYCNYAGYNKNCYLAVGGSWYNENCYYGRHYNHCLNCSDCESIKRSELCYETIWGSNLYNCVHCFGSYNCGHCYFSINLRGCNNCLFCSNLRNKTYYIWNKPASKEEFNKIIAQLASRKFWAKMLEDFARLRRETIFAPYYHTNCENCRGDYLENCKNVIEGYNVFDGEDCKYVLQAETVKDVMDCSSTGYDHPQRFYETVNTGNRGFNVKFSFSSWDVSEISYCDTVMNSHDLFGCVSINRKYHCILNKQYSEEKYKELRDAIIEHMEKTGEYGEFFPMSLAPFAYNESLAQDYFPLTREQVAARGLQWKEEEKPHNKKQTCVLPDNLNETKNDILDAILVCCHCGRNYRIIQQELDFYKKIGVAIPGKCFPCRHMERLHERNLPKLYNRKCAKCSAEIKTTFSPDRPEIVYCEKCYLERVY